MKEKVKKFKKNSSKGITLVALVVTIVVLLILAGVTIMMLFGENGIIKKAEKAKEETNQKTEDEQEKFKNLIDQMNSALDGSGTGEGEGGGETPVEPDVPTPSAESVTVTVGGTPVTLTKSNFGTYLGREVTNYKAKGTGTESVTVGSSTYTVSTTYRLYYVDFDGKYGEKGTVYLKADCAGNNYSLPTDTSSDTETSVKIKQLNPELYKTGVTPPTASNSNMKAVTWLTNTNNWNSLKTSNMVTTNAINSASINYVVGAPSLEMMMDSYNAHYGLTGETPVSGNITAGGERKKLFYQYPYNSNNYGYGVGPGSSSGYSTRTSDYSVQTDSAIDSMYYPGSGKFYWLASPSANDSDIVVYVSSNLGGYVNGNTYDSNYAFCPLVSLKSNVQLEFAD